MTDGGRGLFQPEQAFDRDVSSNLVQVMRSLPRSTAILPLLSRGLLQARRPNQRDGISRPSATHRRLFIVQLTSTARGSTSTFAKCHPILQTTYPKLSSTICGFRQAPLRKRATCQATGSADLATVSLLDVTGAVRVTPVKKRLIFNPQSYGINDLRRFPARH